MEDDLFGGRRGKKNPFGEDGGLDEEPADAVGTIEYAAARIRRLRPLVGAEGLPLSATRELLDHIATALDAVARALEDRGPGG